MLQVNFDEVARGLVVMLLDVEHEMILQYLIDVAPAALALFDVTVHERIGGRGAA